MLVLCKAKTQQGIGEYGIAALVLLTGVASFGLGRLSALEEVRPPVAIRQAPDAVSLRAISLGGEFVAARGGGVYYYPWCPGAQKITPDAQAWFESEKEAQAAGLHPANNCKGLSEPQSAVQ